jgi:hypothetical protein
MLHAYSIPDLSIWCLAVKPQLGPTNTKEYLWIWADFGASTHFLTPHMGNEQHLSNPIVTLRSMLKGHLWLRPIPIIPINQVDQSH